MKNHPIQMETDVAVLHATSLLDHALDLQERYEQQISVQERKEKGQYFTPPEVCSFMAALLAEPTGDTFRFLDPGAGIGSLSAALCERLAHPGRHRRIEAHLFENHAETLPYPRQTWIILRLSGPRR